MIRFMRHLQRARARGDQGAVAVEAALITPILITLVFGMIEFSLLLRDNVATTSLVRVGARIASAEPRQGTIAGCKSNATTDKCFAQDAADAIQRAGSALPKDSIDHINVYLANAKGYPSTTVSGWATDSNTSLSANCGASSATCYTYTWNKTANRFNYTGGLWDPKSINACAGAEGMAVGVSMFVNHNGITGLFFTKFNLSDRAVMKFEPLPAEAPCK
jgi:Flp pilus assembly protein TadG